MYDSEGMTCQQCREVVSATLDGEAGPAERAAADAHLAGCAACRAYEGSARWLGRLARVGPAEPVPDLADGLLRTLGISEPRSAAVAVAAPELTCLPGGCCGDGPADAGDGARSACGCLATCGCGCQDGAPCRCGTKAA